MSNLYRSTLGALLFLLVTSPGCSDSVEQQQQQQRPQRQTQARKKAPRSIQGSGLAPPPVLYSSNSASISMGDPGPPLPLGPGDAAPVLQTSSFVQGEEIGQFEPGQIYVVEFWATWCGPCLQTMPHLSELQKKYEDAVTIIGVTTEDEDVVRGFLKQTADGQQSWSDIITYRIAIDDNEQSERAWREAAESTGIPFAMIVGKTGRIEWKGHPAMIDRPLKAIVEGEWDYRIAREAMKQEINGQNSIDRHQQVIVTAVNAGNFREAVSITNRMLKAMPDNPRILSLQKQLLLEGKMYRQLDTVLNKLVEVNQGNAMELNALAWDIAVELKIPNRNLDLAMAAALRASELTADRNSSILDTVARVHYERGEIQDAIQWQEKAVALQPDAEQLRAVLQEYRSEVVNQASEIGAEK